MSADAISAGSVGARRVVRPLASRSDRPEPSPTDDPARWLRIGDPVTATIGLQEMHAVVTGLELVEPGETYGYPVLCAPWALVPYGVIIADLANGHFAYGHQLRRPD